MGARNDGVLPAANALTVLKKRYLKTDERETIVESPEELFRYAGFP